MKTKLTAYTFEEKTASFSNMSNFVATRAKSYCLRSITLAYFSPL